jgi:hypothetical protein
MPRSIEYGPTLLAGVKAGCWKYDPTGAMAALERALATGLTADVRVEVWCTLARLEIEDGAIKVARDRINAAGTLAERLQSPRSRCLVLHAAGLADTASGDRASAHAAFEQALTIARAATLPLEEASTLSALADPDRRRSTLPCVNVSAHQPVS